jgi:excinuclease ABC subunit C
MAESNSKKYQPMVPTKEMNALSLQVANVATAPGVYLFKNSQGRIVYVGKARNLRKRVQSYFQPGRPHDAKTRIMLDKVVSLETLITLTEKEALILESNLIKRHRPRYNVVLKDDKRYPALRLDMTQTYPNLNMVRKIKNDGALYFGPYASSSAVRQTLKFIHKTFKLRKCHNKIFAGRTRPCLNYQMGLCLGPCCNAVDHQTYQSVVNEVIAFLRGRTPALIQTVKAKMQQAAQAQEFEKAALLRDKMLALAKTLEQQVTVTSDLKDRDVIAMIVDEALTGAALLTVRGGFLMGGRQFVFEHAVGSAKVQMGTLLHQLYGSGQRVPGEILVSHLTDHPDAMVSWLMELHGAVVRLAVPRRGEKARLLQMAVQNAQKAINEKLETDRANLHLLARLQKRLQMDRMPRRIECFDNSNLAGRQPVAAMAVFELGHPQPNANRRYQIHSNGKQDDYAYMAEVLKRRFDKGEGSMPWPDLLLVDGGKGHLNVALAVLADLGLVTRPAVAGIAKKDEACGETVDKVYLPQRSNPVQFGKEMDLLLFLQRIRDEAHRLAISYQRLRRGKKTLQSALDAVVGVGPRRKAMLLQTYGSVNNIAGASVEELGQVPGISSAVARSIKEALSS